MPHEDERKNQLQFLTCPTCQGLGKTGNKACPECQGLGMYAWTGTELLYWSKRISLLQVSQDKIKQGLKNLINLVLFLFGALGVFMLGWVMLALNESNTFAWEFYKLHNWQLFIFWLSLATDGYLVYRFNRELAKIKHIPKREYELTNPTFKPISWPEIKKIPKEKKIDLVDYFNFEAKQSITKAWQLTNKYQDQQTNPIHLLISLLTFDQGRLIFSRLGISLINLKNKIRNSLETEPERKNQPVILSDKIKQIIFQAYFIAHRLYLKKVEITELLEAVASQENKVKELLYDLEITSDKIKNVAAWLRVNKNLRTDWAHFRHRASLRPKNTMNRAMTAIATPVLNALSQDLTLLGRAGYLVPCIGRGKVIEKIFNIMHGGTRRSVILVGQPGIGKDTIVEGIAQKMVAETVPKFLQDKRLVNLNIAKLVSGVNPAQAQERLLLVLNEIKRSGNIVLAISDIHNLTGISAGAEGSIDVADILAKALGNNNILAIATTTPMDYRKYIEGKSSLDNVLERINVEEVSGNEAIQILESKVGSIERKNQVFFSYDAIAKTVDLSNRYLHDRYLPEKAIEILQEVATHVRQQKGKNNMVEANDVALVISAKTNIPLTEITKEESTKLLKLEQRIHQRMINQEEAVEMVASSLRRARAEMRDLKRPIVNLLFLGPTGVGKTELAKTLAEVYFGGEKNMIRLDMSEYQDKASINRLIGAPPGYAGSDQGGYLTEAVRKNPFSLVLLDEIEKAYPDILNIFLQVMEDGHLTDSLGRLIDFTNTIIIATSNAGTKFIQEMIKKNVPTVEIKEQLIETRLNQYFRPEFLNRFNGIVVFKPLTPENVEAIAKLMLKKVAQSLKAKGINLKVTPQAIKDLAQAGFDPQFGARPLRRVIQKQVQDPLANHILAGNVKRRDTAVVEAGGKIRIEKAKRI